MIDDGLPTHTWSEQTDLEARVVQLYQEYLEDGGFSEEDPALVLTRKQHAKFLLSGLGELPSGFIALDASRAWIVYWVTHGLALLGVPLPAEVPHASLVAFLASCQHPEGGFGGGPYQLAHLAPTYAAVSALVTLGGEEALGAINREALWHFLLRMCVPPEQGGGMTMHKGGEVDVRGCYCALAVCHMLNLDKEALAEACGMVQYVKACQSYEGGLGGEPWNEAHGGYTFCGLAALVLLGQADVLDLPRMLRWAAGCQGGMEGGFQGRTNKLVDGCYSFWQGAAFPLLQRLLAEQQQRQQRRQQQRQEQRQPPSTAQHPSSSSGSAVLSAAAQAAAAHLLSGEAEAFVAGLHPLPPVAAAECRLVQLQKELDEVVEQSLQADDLAKAAAESQSGKAAALEQEAAALLDKASEVQKAVERATTQLEATQCSAAALLEGAVREEGPGGDCLYHAPALQLWLLKCCQGPRGGLRDKPGKGPDYYHTCYCLSGLSSCQASSGGAMGGPDNRLAKADPLCNVVEDKLAEALAHFGRMAPPQ